MEHEESAIICGLLFCLAVAIIGLCLGAGSPCSSDLEQRSAHRASHAGQILLP